MVITWLEKNKIISWSITSMIAIFIFYISSLPGDSAPGISGTSIDAILYHIVIYFFLAFFLFISLTEGRNRRLIYIGVVMALLYGISDELHQLLVPGRVGSIEDLMLNSVGIVFAVVGYLISLEARRK
jgi:VanZ family protein